MQDNNTFYKVMRVIARPIIFLIVKFKIFNPNTLPKSGRILVVSNHVSGFDPICIGLGQKRPIRFIAKKELFENKFVNWFFHKLGAIPVDRDKNDVKAMKEFMRGLKNEEAMGIFIEGTRSRTGDFLEPKEGAALFAYQCDSNILPVCITKVGKRRIIRFGEIVTTEDMRFNDDSLSKKEKLKYATDLVFSKIKALREMDK